METPETMTEQQSAAIYGGSPEPSAVAGMTDTTPGNSPCSDTAAMIAEAEQRGYLRGRNEAITELMNRPTMWQPVDPSSPAGRMTAAADAFLSGLRPGVWER